MSQEFNYNKVVSDLRISFANGKLKSYEVRCYQLSQLNKLLDENNEAICDALWKDLRKSKQEVKMFEILPVKAEIAEIMVQLDKFMKPERIKSDLQNMQNTLEIRNEPYGIVLILSAWNYPFLLALKPLVGAIAAGNCCVLKPSELAPNIATTIGNLIPKYLDNEFVKVINGGIPETTALLRERFDYIFYIGSTNVGKIILKAASNYFTPVTLEMGGKCPAIVDKSCDLDVVANRIAWGKFINAGQTCLTVDYILCVDGIQDELINALKKSILKFYGEDPQRSTDYGRIINNRNFQRVTKLIKKSNIVHGGDFDEKDLYISPTILKNISVDDDIMKEEIFGPLLPIINVVDVEEAVQFVNQREKPLALYVFSKEKKTIDFVLQNTSSGGVTVNDVIMHATALSLPFGGVGESGMGAYNGIHSLKTFSHQKSCLIASQRFESLNNVRYPPYPSKENFMVRFITDGLNKKINRSGGNKYWTAGTLLIACGVVILAYFNNFKISDDLKFWINK
ncbi:aldehyde dehydrogenase, dimeric NADP-preferring isoform X1 [Hydra vulgaris]|uniref:aldehyde dehydrogenase, dimeric NADP-preferring isoform X1 n=1 Tax=Hydra vulgaris TaxID=6087 RepID=UPI001F5FD465|nr:aldehyde dehydrogenase, dimeric NADP-preferring-like [Hydra vulgaris]